MVQPSISLCLVPEARGGPFVLCGSLEAGIRRAAKLGYPAVELFARSANDIAPRKLQAVLDETGLKVSAFSTGAGFMLQRIHLCHPDVDVRRRAREFILGFIRLAGEFGGFPIIGLMRGMVERGDSAREARRRMEDALSELDEAASRAGRILLIEPINRYETTLINRLDEGVELIESQKLGSTRLLADTFHMNIEEASIEPALTAAAAHLAHVHWADSNRRPPGCGHLDFAAIARTLQAIGYQGHIAFECLPFPSPERAAASAAKAFSRYFGTGGAVAPRKARGAQSQPATRQERGDP